MIAVLLVTDIVFARSEGRYFRSIFINSCVVRNAILTIFHCGGYTDNLAVCLVLYCFSFSNYIGLGILGFGDCPCIYLSITRCECAQTADSNRLGAKILDILRPNHLVFGSRAVANKSKLFITRLGVNYQCGLLVCIVVNELIFVSLHREAIGSRAVLSFIILIAICFI